MTTTVYLVRHCESFANLNKVFSGWTDVDITENGKKQLELLSDRFKGENIHAIYSSPISRAVKTANAINAHHNLPLQIHEGVKELNGGVLEGEYWETAHEKFPKVIQLWEEAPWDFEVEGGETMRFVFERMRDAVLEIATSNKGKTVAIASHGCALRNFLCYAKGLEIESINEVNWLDNTAVTRVDFDENLVPNLVFENDTTHLADLI